MDIEEVTKWLKIMKANLNTFPEISSEKKIEALAEAIRLLKNEQSEKPTGSDDCISREDALMCLTGKFEIRGYEPSELVSIFSKRIKALPPVTPIRPKGHWIYDKSFANWICSKCGETPKTMGYVGTSAFMAEHFKYCNHCGAEMEGAEG